MAQPDRSPGALRLDPALVSHQLQIGKRASLEKYQLRKFYRMVRDDRFDSKPETVNRSAPARQIMYLPAFWVTHTLALSLVGDCQKMACEIADFADAHQQASPRLIGCHSERSLRSEESQR